MLKLSGLRNEITEKALAGLSAADTHLLVAQLEIVKDNVREAIQHVPAPTHLEFKEPTYG
jgi:MarR family transcriptional regulator for hemolysin